MTLSMYQASIPGFVRMLENFSAILDKAVASAEARKIDPAVFVNARLSPDMHPLSRQIQIATDTVKGGGARLAQVDVPSFADTETTFPELKERLAKTVAFLNTLTAAQIDGSEDRTVTMKARPRELSFTGRDYLFNFVIPNLYFHLMATYAILRHNGVDVGKMDFLGAV